MVVASDLLLYQVESNDGQEQLLYNDPGVTNLAYGVAPYWQGLGLIPEYVVPHMDKSDHMSIMQERISNIERAGATVIRLNDDDVLIVNGEQDCNNAERR